MSLIICVHVEEGIVLASDSRSSYNKREGNNNFIGIHSTNTTNKTFKCENNTGISVCGDASVKGKPITGYIESFIREKIQKQTNIEDMPKLIKEYFNSIDSSLDSTFIIAGYKKEEEKYIQKIYSVRTSVEEVEVINTESQGAVWKGETLTLTKLLTPVYVKEMNKENYILLPMSEIAWNLYTLQDAVDFAKYGIKTTIDTLKFQAVPETVGGAIDILIIKPESVEWLQKKELK